MKRPQQHVMEDKAEKLIRGILPDNWIIRTVPKDYGIDFEIEMVDQEFVTGNRIWVQSKAVSKLKRNFSDYDVSQMGLTNDDVPGALDGKYRVAYFNYRIETKELDYALRCPFPLLLFLCDLEKMEIYWLPLREEALCSVAPTNRAWRDQQTVTIRVPEWNCLSWEATKHFPGLKWYALEPARMAAFVNLHYYYHEFQHTGRLSGYVIGEGFVDHGEEEELRSALLLAKQYIQDALKLNVLFGSDGIDFFTTQIPNLGIVPIAEQFRLALDATEVAFSALDSGKYEYISMGLLLGQVDHAINLLSTAISAYQGFRQKFLFTEASVLWRAGARIHGFEGPPVLPTDRQKSRGA